MIVLHLCSLTPETCAMQATGNVTTFLKTHDPRDADPKVLQEAIPRLLECYA
jgi:hypothetical protein